MYFLEKLTDCIYFLYFKNDESNTEYIIWNLILIKKDKEFSWNHGIMKNTKDVCNLRVSKLMYNQDIFTLWMIGEVWKLIF